ncbi:TPA: acylphosphatase [archaeon]|uniref:acylphosphatase n=1 Tax=Candidatus Naiadarchaeum limnaeum TaxID=2756139 RepID=A0A832V696_9ARCH|nr:acylphosphatase [Candidatus Naiadarchaeum limnaeum]
MKYRIVLNGVVQGVGCRSLVRGVAKKMNVGGCVRNMENGSVEVYVEAAADKFVENLVAEIKRTTENTMVDIMNVKIYNEDQNEFYSSKPPKDYSEFRIEHSF